MSQLGERAAIDFRYYPIVFARSSIKLFYVSLAKSKFFAFCALYACRSVSLIMILVQPREAIAC